ncbi:MAG: hypothetical protein EBZ86_08890 [Synechococcaceae bacterium WB9_2_069]|nr:hypothetical protein [Synechococcaceae bacterium WB9_2_069]
MPVFTPIPAAPADFPAAAPSANGPACSLQRSSSLWQLGIEAQELTTAIGQLAQQLACPTAAVCGRASSMPSSSRCLRFCTESCSLPVQPGSSSGSTAW